MLVRTRTIFEKDSQRYGLAYAVKHLVVNLLQSVLFRCFRITFEDSISRAQLRLSRYLHSSFGGKVKYGPFSGLQLQWDSSWGAKSRGTMLLGIYEKEILHELIKASENYRYFIDVGAADGYYALGVLSGGYFEISYCYEESLNGRKVIKKNSQINGLEERTIIKGHASSDFYRDLKTEIRDESVLLVDVEGGEFKLLSSEALFAFRNSIIIIEIHDWMVPKGQSELIELESRASKYFNIKKVQTGARDPSLFVELADFSDSERWIVCSESREKLQTWWVLTPR